MVDDELIRRKDVIKLAESAIQGSLYFGYPTLLDFVEKIKHLPSIHEHPVHMKKGKWKWIPLENGTAITICSVCGHRANGLVLEDYCPSCGVELEKY